MMDSEFCVEQFRIKNPPEFLHEKYLAFLRPETIHL